jgi:hypothetical protein
MTTRVQMWYRGAARWIAPAIALAALAAQPAQATPGPAEVLQRYLAAANAGDMPAVRSLIAPDVERSDFVGCTPDMDNAACLAFYIETTVVAPHGQITLLHTEVVGDTVTGWLTLRSDLTRRLGVERVAGRDVLRVWNGQIRSFRFHPDFEDDATAVFFGSLGIGPRATGPHAGDARNEHR